MTGSLDSTDSADARSDEGADRPATEPAELVASDLAVGYERSDEPVVECEHVLLPAGEITALVGPNGSGKSTLLKTLAGQLDPWSGAVTLDGEDVHAMADKPRARRIGLLSQQRESPTSITVEELVAHGRYPYRGFLDPLDADDEAAVGRAIDLADVEHLRDRQLGSLSGGQMQLAWIAMVLAQQPDVLLLDEPTTFLDLRHQLRVLETVESLNRDAGVTVGLVVHDLSQAVRHADNLVAIRDGEPYDWGPPSKVVTEELLAEVFGVDATVNDGDGRDYPEVVPHRPTER